VAMQFFYQFPQRTERLVLVSSGGLGHEVSPLLRGAALPGASALLSLAAHPRHAGHRDLSEYSECPPISAVSVWKPLPVRPRLYGVDYRWL